MAEGGCSSGTRRSRPNPRRCPLARGALQYGDAPRWGGPDPAQPTQTGAKRKAREAVGTDHELEGHTERDRMAEDGGAEAERPREGRSRPERTQNVGASAPAEGSDWGQLAAPASKDDGRRQSSNIEAAVLFGEMVRARLKTICFCSVRKICELTLDYARQHLQATEGAEAASKVGAYRGGLTPADRRRIERHLYDGTLRGVTATSSLELGVDIAELDGVVMVGFPGSLASMWQRAGRCGRSAASDALCIVIAYPSPIDQWAMRHPARLLAMGVEDVIVDTANPIVLRQHLLCAAREQPLTADADADVFGVREVRGVLREELPEELTEARTAGAEGHVGPTGGAATRNLDAGEAGGAEGAPTDEGRLFGESVAELLREGQLVPLPPARGVAPSWRCDVLVEKPEALVNIRSIDQSRVQVIMQSSRRRTQPTMAEALSGGGGGAEAAARSAAGAAMEAYEEVVDEVEQWRCWYELYEGAIYLNQGRKLEVVSWEVFSGVVRVRPSSARYYTGCLDKITVTVLQVRPPPYPSLPTSLPAALAGMPSPDAVTWCVVMELQRSRTCALHLKAVPAEDEAYGGGAKRRDDDHAGQPCYAPGWPPPGNPPPTNPPPRNDGEPASCSTADRAHMPDTLVASVLGQLCLGRVQVRLDVAGFVKRWQRTGEIFEEVRRRQRTQAKASCSTTVAPFRRAYGACCPCAPTGASLPQCPRPHLSPPVCSAAGAAQHAEQHVQHARVLGRSAGDGRGHARLGRPRHRRGAPRRSARAPRRAAPPPLVRAGRRRLRVRRAAQAPALAQAAAHLRPKRGGAGHLRPCPPRDAPAAFRRNAPHARLPVRGRMLLLRPHGQVPGVQRGYRQAGRRCYHRDHPLRRRPSSVGRHHCSRQSGGRRCRRRRSS